MQVIADPSGGPFHFSRVRVRGGEGKGGISAGGGGPFQSALFSLGGIRSLGEFFLVDLHRLVIGNMALVSGSGTRNAEDYIYLEEKVIIWKMGDCVSGRRRIARALLHGGKNGVRLEIS